jgi:hypothetical protein
MRRIILKKKRKGGIEAFSASTMQQQQHCTQKCQHGQTIGPDGPCCHATAADVVDQLTVQQVAKEGVKMGMTPQAIDRVVRKTTDVLRASHSKNTKKDAPPNQKGDLLSATTPSPFLQTQTQAQIEAQANAPLKAKEAKVVFSLTPAVNTNEQILAQSTVADVASIVLANSNAVKEMKQIEQKEAEQPKRWWNKVWGHVKDVSNRFINWVGSVEWGQKLFSSTVWILKQIIQKMFYLNVTKLPILKILANAKMGWDPCFSVATIGVLKATEHALRQIGSFSKTEMLAWVTRAAAGFLGLISGLGSGLVVYALLRTLIYAVADQWARALQHILQNPGEWRNVKYAESALALVYSLMSEPGFFNKIPVEMLSPIHVKFALEEKQYLYNPLAYIDVTTHLISLSAKNQDIHVLTNCLDFYNRAKTPLDLFSIYGWIRPTIKSFQDVEHFYTQWTNPKHMPWAMGEIAQMWMTPSQFSLNQRYSPIALENAFL